MPGQIFIGTAGWTIPRAFASYCDGPGTHLERYARMFAAAEINSSFHRPHAAATYAKWASCAPAGFRFAVKLPREITHDRALRRVRPALERFLEDSSGLQARRGPLLVQLPGSHAFDARVVGRFFELLRSIYDGAVVCEPRHASWLAPRAETLLARFQVARVAADPARAPGFELPGGWPGLAYFRLHGSPHVYWSRYTPAFIERLAAAVMAVPPPVDAWCIFDNTATGSAIENAQELRDVVAGLRNVVAGL